MQYPTEIEAQEAMGRRLQQIRLALNLSQDALAQTLGVGVTTLSAWETGRNRIDIVKLARAAARYRFTTDWITLGDLSGLPHHLAERVEQQQGLPSLKRRGRPSGKGLPDVHDPRR